VLKEEKDVAQFMDTKGLVLFQKGKYAEALKFFEDAYRLQPSDVIIVEHLGDAWIKNGNAEKAIDYWKRAKELGAVNKNLPKKIEKKEYYDPIY
jgi:tetratricopeptide (TPR) repeat protein